MDTRRIINKIRMVPTILGLWLMQRRVAHAVGRLLFGLFAPKCVTCGVLLEDPEQAKQGVCAGCQTQIWN